MNFDANSSATLSTLRQQISEMGPQFNETVLQKTRALYRPLLPAASEKVKVQRDLAYAAHGRQRLDLYAPVGAARLPLLIYVPGGGFVGGDKRSEDAFYANIGAYFAERGFVVLIMNYRLAPDHPWPAGGEDVGHVVAWATEHASAHGGDPGRIALFGQSASIVWPGIRFRPTSGHILAPIARNTRHGRRLPMSVPQACGSFSWFRN